MQHVATLVTWSTILLLVMTSILSHPYAAAVLTSAQALVSFFRASHRPYEVLKAACRAANPPVNTGLRSANTTRLTSSFDMLGSVLVPRPAFQAFAFVEVECDPTLLPAKQAGMLVNLKSETWWSDLQQVHELLRPFAEVVMAIQAHDSTLADVTRYWLYLNQATEALLPQLSSAAFQQHVCAAFNKRAVEMDSPLCRLALFLDPRYRAIGGSQAALEELTKVALRVTARSGGGELRLEALRQQLLAYQKNLPPFNQPWTTATTPRTYWKALDNDQDAPQASAICSLALRLHSVVPSAATPERVFSFVEITTDSNNRHNLNVRTVHKMASVKQYLAGEQPKKFTVAAAPAAKQRRAATASSSSSAGGSNSGKAPAKQRKLTLVPGGQLTLAPLQQGTPAAATSGSDQQLQRLPSGLPPAGPSSSPLLGMLPWGGAYPTAGVQQLQQQQQQQQQQWSPMAPALPEAGMASSAALPPPTAGMWAGVQQQPHRWSEGSPNPGQQVHGALSSGSSIQPSSTVGWGAVTPQQSWVGAGALALPDVQQLPATSTPASGTGGGSIIAPLEGAAAAAVGNPADETVHIDLTTQQQEQPDAGTGDGDMDQHDLGVALEVAWARDQEEEEQLQRMAASQDVVPEFKEQVEIAKKYTKACGFMWLLTAQWEGYSLVQPEHLHPKAQPAPVQPLPAARKKRFHDEDQVDDAMFD